MKPVAQILEYIALRIGHIYFRPLMYGGNAEGVDLILNNYHELWSEIVDRYDEYRNISSKVHTEQDCRKTSFAKGFKMKNLNVTEQESAFYVVDQWQKVSYALELPIPYEEIKELLKHLKNSDI